MKAVTNKKKLGEDNSMPHTNKSFSSENCIYFLFWIGKIDW